MTEKRCKKKTLKGKILFLSFVFLCIVVLIFIYLEMVVNPMIISIAEAQIDSLGTTAVSDAIFEVVNNGDIDYADLVSISYDNEGNISSITSNMEKMNFIAREISTKAQIMLDDMSGCGVKIAIGAFTGLEVFSQVGPQVNLRLMPIGSVITSFDSTFESAGINQTKHAIYIDVNTTISVILPTSSKKLAFVTSALICESIIVGKVPEIYLNQANV